MAKLLIDAIKEPKVVREIEDIVFKKMYPTINTTGKNNDRIRSLEHTVQYLINEVQNIQSEKESSIMERISNFNLEG